MKSIEDILKEIELIKGEIHHAGSNDKYNMFAKTILAANYILFITVVWKSFDLNGEIPALAKLSMLFFGFGCMFSAIRYLADYISDAIDNLPNYKKLIKIEEEYGAIIKENQPGAFIELRLITRSIKWALRQGKNDQEVPQYIYTIIYFLIDVTALLISFTLLSIGLFLLGISAI